MKVRLKYWRQRRALSIENLAEKANMSTQTLVNIEKYGKEPRPSTIRRLAEALEVSLDELIEVKDETEETPPPEEKPERVGSLAIFGVNRSTHEVHSYIPPQAPDPEEK